MNERYRNVHQRGFIAGMDAATDALRAFLASGGQVAVAPFRYDLVIRYPAGLVGEIASLQALAPHNQMIALLLPEKPE